VWLTPHLRDPQPEGEREREKQPFITAQSPVITAHFVYHCTLFYALGWSI